MPRKKIEEKPIEEKIQEIKAPDVLESNFMPYAISVIMSRAIPEIDGLKPSHRKILYTMYEMGLLTGIRTKSANVAARTMLLNPHGDCLSGDTIFEDLAGNRYTIKELCENNTREIECLSVNIKNGKLERTKVNDFRIGQHTTTVYKIRLGNGHILQTTGNHPILCVNNNGNLEYIKAEDLKEGTILYGENIIENSLGYWAVNSIPLHLIINDIPKGMVLHHKDFNRKNNLSSNSMIIERGLHATIHKDYYKGLTIGRNSMFNEDGKYRKKIKEKNEFLLTAYNKVQPVMRFYKVIDWMKSHDIELNEENYKEARISSGIYRPPYANTLIENGYATSFEDLLEQRESYEKYISSTYKDFKAVNRNTDPIVEETKKKSIIGDDMRQLATFNRAFIVFDEMYRDKDDISWAHYEEKRKYLSRKKKEHRYRLSPIFKTSSELEECLNLYLKKRPVVISIEKIVLETAIPMYDFTAPQNNNVLLPTEEGLWICVHNSSAYEAAVRLTQNNETLLTPLIDGKGNFGKHYSRDAVYAAARYTEMKLMPIATEFFKSIRKDAVDFVDNYDSTKKEPVLLPVTFPNILANPTEGIAVGMASSIPSFNLSELCSAAILRTMRSRKDIIDVMPGPDFTTGGEILLNEAAMKEIYKTGRGSITIRSKYTVNAKSRVIEVYEIPYSTTAEAIIENIISLIKSGKITEISDVRNEIGLHGFRLAIDYKRGVDPDGLMKKLFLLTKLQDTYSCNMTVLIDGRPKQIGVTEIIDEWIKWRRECVRRELTFDHKQKSHELHLLEGLAKVLLDIDKAIRIIRKTEKNEDVIPALMKGFKLDEEQASYVAEIKLRNLNREYILGRTKNIEQLKDEIALIEKQLSSEKEIDKLIVKTLKEVQKKYGQERKTDIVTDFEVLTPSVVPDKPDYPVKVYITKEGYVKKVALTSMKNDPEIKFKEGDEVTAVYDNMNSDELIVFSDKQAAYKTRLSDMKDSKPSDVADFIRNLCELAADENILHVCTSGKNKNILIAFENGKVAKFPMSAYETKQNRKKLLNAYGGVADPLRVFVIEEDEDFVLEDSKGRFLVFSSGKIPLKTTKSTQGVQTIRLSSGVTAVSFGRPDEYELKDIEAFRAPNIPAAGRRT